MSAADQNHADYHETRRHALDLTRERYELRRKLAAEGLHHFDTEQETGNLRVEVDLAKASGLTVRRARPRPAAQEKTFWDDFLVALGFVTLWVVSTVGFIFVVVRAALLVDDGNYLAAAGVVAVLILLVSPIFTWIGRSGR